MTQAPTTPRTMSQAELFRLQFLADRRGFFRPEPMPEEEEDEGHEYFSRPGIDHPYSLVRPARYHHG